MGNLLTRRRELILASGGSSEWDVEWDYTDGLPNNNGWTRTASGSYRTATMQDDGFYLATANSCNTTYAHNDSGCTVGVIEAVLYVPQYTSSTTNLLAYLHIGNADAALRVYFYNNNTSKAVRLNNNSTLKSGTNLGAFAVETEYTVTLKINNGVGQYYLDGVLKKDNIDLSTVINKGTPRFGAYNGGANPNFYGAVWKSVKIKVGRLE